MITQEDIYTVAALNRLHQAESRSLACLVLNLSPHVPAHSAAVYEAVKQIAADHREHCGWLAEAIADHYGAVQPTTLDPRLAGMHYIGFDALAPHLLADEQRLLNACAEAGKTPGLTPNAAAVIARISSRHQSHLRALQHFGGNGVARG